MYPIGKKGTSTDQMILGALLGLTNFIVVFTVLLLGGVDRSLSAILAVAAGFGTLAVVVSIDVVVDFLSSIFGR